MSVVHFYLFVQQEKCTTDIRHHYIGMAFPGTAGNMRCFNSQSVINMIGVTSTNETTASSVDYAIDAVNTFVQTSAMLLIWCKLKCNDALNSRKKLSKNFCFWLLRYTSLFVPKTGNCSLELDAKRSLDQKEVYAKLSKWRICGARDTTWWQITKYREIRAEGHLGCSWKGGKGFILRSSVRIGSCLKSVREVSKVFSFKH